MFAFAHDVISRMNGTFQYVHIRVKLYILKTQVTFLKCFYYRGPKASLYDTASHTKEDIKVAMSFVPGCFIYCS